jgi:hypothetical protein
MGGPLSPRSPTTDTSPGSPRGVPPPAFLQFFNAILGNAHGPGGTGRFGDVAWSQEEFDRIMSQLMEQQGSTAPGPATQEAINSLPKKTVDKNMVGESGKAECTICMDDVSIGDEVTELYCKHWFHTNCITSWLNEHNTCPHCRMGIEEARRKANGEGPGKGGGSNDPNGSASGGPGNAGSSGGGVGSNRPSWFPFGGGQASGSGFSGSGAQNRSSVSPAVASHSTPRERTRRHSRFHFESSGPESTRRSSSRTSQVNTSEPTSPLPTGTNDPAAAILRNIEAVRNLNQRERMSRRHSHASSGPSSPTYAEAYRPPTPPLGRRRTGRSGSFGVNSGNAGESNTFVDRWDRNSVRGRDRDDDSTSASAIASGGSRRHETRPDPPMISPSTTGFGRSERTRELDRQMTRERRRDRLFELMRERDRELNGESPPGREEQHPQPRHREADRSYPNTRSSSRRLTETNVTAVDAPPTTADSTRRSSRRRHRDGESRETHTGLLDRDSGHHPTATTTSGVKERVRSWFGGR